MKYKPPSLDYDVTFAYVDRDEIIRLLTLFLEDSTNLLINVETMLEHIRKVDDVIKFNSHWIWDYLMKHPGSSVQQIFSASKLRGDRRLLTAMDTLIEKSLIKCDVTPKGKIWFSHELEDFDLEYHNS